MRRRYLALLALLPGPALAQVVLPGGSPPMACVYNSAPPTLTTGQVGLAQCDSTGHLVSGAGAITSWAGSTLGAITTYGTSPGAVLVPSVNAFVTNTNANGAATAANSSPVVNAYAAPAGAIAPNNTTAVVVKASPGTVTSIQLAGIGSAPVYLKLYNATSATCGSGTPVKRLMIPAASTAALGSAQSISLGAGGVYFSTGITYCLTTGITDADTTAPAANTFLVNIDYQ